MISKLLRIFKTAPTGISDPEFEKQVRELVENGEAPIYHVHIRKTAGTTINFAFLSNAVKEDTSGFYDQLAKKDDHCLISNSKVFAAWNANLINSGLYSYAFSHLPLHKLKIPGHVFRFTCLRDPARRVISHYNMLRYYQINQVDHPAMQTEGKWLGNSFDDFLNNVPAEHLNNQLYMFSADFNISEALDELNGLDMVIRTEELEQGMKQLESITSWILPVSNQKKYPHKEELTEYQLEKLKELLQPEYDLMQQLNK